MKVINLESMRNVIRNPALYGSALAFIGAVGIFSYVASNPHELSLKEDGDNAISIQLSAFVPPSKDIVSNEVTKPKPKKKVHKKKPKQQIEAPPKPVESDLQAKQEPVVEEVKEVVEPVQEEVVAKEIPKEEVKESKVATTVKSSPKANSDKSIKFLRYSDGVDDPFLKAIRALIQKRNEYPQLARSRGYEDTVLLRFVVNTDGSVSNEKVYKKSKYEVLNKAALKALHKAKRNFPKPTQITYIEIPIEYGLE